jgi:cytochrome c553
MNLVSPPRKRPIWTRITSLFVLTALASTLISSALRADSPGTRPHLLAQGKYIASMCTTCHQPDKSFEGIPPILGYKADKMIEMMMEYKESVEQHEVMENIAKSLSEYEIRALALYLASLKSQGRSM